MSEPAARTGLLLPAPADPAGRPPARARWGAGVVWVWELDKLSAQLRTRLALAAVLVGPLCFVAAVRVSGTIPADTLFGRWVGDSGLATPLLVLGFAAAWGIPALTCLVAGDIFSSEDQLGTWKTVLTRAYDRGAFFAGKVLAALSYVVVVLGLAALSSLAAGLLLVGGQPLVALSGNVLPAGHACVLVLLAWASVLPPSLAFAGLGVMLSVLTRNSLAGVVGPVVIGLAMQFATMLDGLGPARQALLSTQLYAWHGLFAAPMFWRPLVWDALVSGGYLLVTLGLAWAVLRRRDVRGG